MILCLCNALSDKQVTEAVEKGAAKPREVYAHCACKAQCGTCTRLILTMIRDLAAPPAAQSRAS
jgi:bacterioferritin-associated ferredoxin